MGVLPHIIWASSGSSCCLSPLSPLCALRPTQLSPTPPATTFPTPTGLPTPTLPSSTLLLPDARTRPVLWCLVPTVVSFPSDSSQLLLPLLLRLPPLWRRQGRRGRQLRRLRPKPILKLRPKPGS